MRFRTILMILAILLLAGFVALNVDEFTRISVLSLGFTTIELPLGLVMLALLIATVLIFMASALYTQSKYALEARTHTRELNTQRELADKAEASRVTELRAYLEEQTLAEQRRESALGTVLADRFAQQQQVLLTVAWCCSVCGWSCCSEACVLLKWGAGPFSAAAAASRKSVGTALALCQTY